MIYLVRATYYDETQSRPVRLLRIGYTADLKKQMTVLRSANPFIELVSQREGDKSLSLAIQYAVSRYQYPGTKDWFIWDPQVISCFEGFAGRVSESSLREKLLGVVAEVTKKEVPLIQEALENMSLSFSQRYMKWGHLVIQRFKDLMTTYLKVIRFTGLPTEGVDLRRDRVLLTLGFLDHPFTVDMGSPGREQVIEVSDDDTVKGDCPGIISGMFYNEIFDLMLATSLSLGRGGFSEGCFITPDGKNYNSTLKSFCLELWRICEERFIGSL